MSSRRGLRFIPVEEGGYQLLIDDDRRAFLHASIENHRELLMADHPSLRRLFPDPYPGDEARSAEFQKLMHGDLLESQFAALDTFEHALDAEVLHTADLEAWLRAINSMRLAIGTILEDEIDVEDVYDLITDELEESDPELYRLLLLYDHLGSFLEPVLLVLAGELPPPSAEPPTG